MTDIEADSASTDGTTDGSGAGGGSVELGPPLNSDGSLDTHEIGIGGDRILTVPNLISVLRLCCLPVFLWLLFAHDERAWAGFLLGCLAATDWVDGWVARRFDQVSNLGKQLDPLVDRSLMVVAVVAIIIDGSAPIWFAVLTVFREVAMSLWVVGLAVAGAPRMDVTWFGKKGTYGQMQAWPAFLLAAGTTGGWSSFWEAFAWIGGIPGLVFGYIAFGQYLVMGRAAWAERS